MPTDATDDPGRGKIVVYDRLTAHAAVKWPLPRFGEALALPAAKWQRPWLNHMLAQWVRCRCRPRQWRGGGLGGGWRTSALLPSDKPRGPLCRCGHCARPQVPSASQRRRQCTTIGKSRGSSTPSATCPSLHAANMSNEPNASVIGDNAGARTASIRLTLASMERTAATVVRPSRCRQPLPAPRCGPRW